MEVYSVRVKVPIGSSTLPSERRYSAATVAGLGWVHAALAATAALLAVLALLAPTQHASEATGGNYTGDNYTLAEQNQEWCSADYILVVVPALVSAAALASAAACALASVRWYIDSNITWLLVASSISSLVSLAACATVLVWFAAADGHLADFYKDHEPFGDYIAVKREAVIEGNSSHVLVQLGGREDSRQFSRRVLCINVLIAGALEALWSLLSVHISYRGTRAQYSAPTPPPRQRVSLVTELRGKAPLHKLYEGKNDLEGKERVLSFLQRCDSSASTQSPGSLHPIPEYIPSEHVPSWGDTPPHPVYTQDTLDLHHIFNTRHRADTAPQS